MAYLNEVFQARIMANLGYETVSNCSILKKLSYIKPFGVTALRDSIKTGIEFILELNTILKNAGLVSAWNFVHIVITDGSDTCSKCPFDNLAALFHLVGKKIPKERCLTVFIGIDLNENALAELALLTALGGDTSQIYNIKRVELDSIFQKITATLIGFRREVKLELFSAGGVTGIDFEKREQAFFKLSRTNFAVLLNLDISGSMEGDKFGDLKRGVVKFLNNLDGKDLVSCLVFNKKVELLQNINTASSSYFKSSYVKELHTKYDFKLTKATTKVPVKVPIKLQIKSPAKSPSKSPEKKPTKLFNKSRASSLEKLPAKSPANLLAKSRALSLAKLRAKLRAKSAAKSPSKSPAKLSPKSPAKLPPKSPEKLPAKSFAKLPEKSPAKAPAKSPAYSPPRSPVKESFELFPIAPKNAIPSACLKTSPRAPTNTSPTKFGRSSPIPKRENFVSPSKKAAILKLILAKKRRNKQPDRAPVSTPAKSFYNDSGNPSSNTCSYNYNNSEKKICPCCEVF